MEISIDIWAEITKRLDIWEILNMFRLSKRHRALSERDDIWKVIFRKHYGEWSEAEFPGKTWRQAKKYLLCLRKTLLEPRFVNSKEQSYFKFHLERSADRLYIRSSERAMAVCEGFGGEDWLKDGDIYISHEPNDYGIFLCFKSGDINPPAACCWPHKPISYCQIADMHAHLDRPLIFIEWTKEQFQSCETFYHPAVSRMDITDPRDPSKIWSIADRGYQAIKDLIQTDGITVHGFHLESVTVDRIFIEH